jgi:transposase
VIVAGDEAAVQLQATVQVVWAPQGQTPVVKVTPNRACVHFYGALNLHTGQEIVMRAAVMTAAVTVLFLQRLLETYPAQRILLLWDRAPWHRGQLIQEWLAANPRLEIFELPAGAPDLNPQEHVWKDARSHVSHNHAVKQIDQLAEQFEAHLLNHAFPCSLLEQHNYDEICMMFK